MTSRFSVRLLSALSVAAVVGSMFGTSESQAQHFRPGQELGRLLGVGIGNGYHCRTPGPNVDYYNPWSATNSHLVSRYQDTGAWQSGHGGMQGLSDPNQFVPHRVYTGHSDGYSVFENVPGQTLTPSFEPADKMNVPKPNAGQSQDYDAFNGDESEFESRSREADRSMDDNQRSPIDDGYGETREDDDSDYRDDDGGFQELQDNFESLEKDEPPTPRSGSQPSEEEQVRFFMN